MSRRLERVNVLLRNNISRIISSELSDPRLGGVHTVTSVDTSPDLSHAHVYVSVLGDDDSKTQTIEVLRSAEGVIRRGLRSTDLRRIPQLSFDIDDSIERGDEILRLLNEAIDS